MNPYESFISANGIRLHVRDWGGPAGARLSMVLLHGLASNARIWDLVAPLLARDFHVIAIDQRGHGASDKPDDGYDYATVTRDLAEVIAALHLELPLLVGHSWGASVALQYAAFAPDTLAGAALVDGGTAEFIEVMSRDEMFERLAPPRLAGTPRAEFVAALRDRWLREFWSPAVEEAVMASFTIDATDRIAPHLSFDNHLKIVAAMWEHRPSLLFPRVTCPLLIVPAAQHIITDEAATWMAFKRASVARAVAMAPRARVVWANDSHHDVPLHHPHFLATVLSDFAHEIAPLRH
ncbi:MAG: alpha/beta hydrolase [Chloroflexi bacterium]|nr:alpha/beta hydrolase [Chloroflexota bacterium]